MSSRVSEEQIRAEVERIAQALGKKPPQQIEVEYEAPSTRPRLEENGERLILNGGWGLKDVRDQIVWTLLEPDLKNHENPFVRNPHRYDMVLVVLVVVGFAAILTFFPLIPLAIRILSVVVLLISYLFTVRRLGPYKQEYAKIVGEAMMKTGNWPETRAKEFIRKGDRMGLELSIFLAILLGVTGVALAVLFDILDIPSLF